MKKQIFGVCTAICLMLMTVFPAFAAAETPPYDDIPIVFTTMVSDSADILTDSEEIWRPGRPPSSFWTRWRWDMAVIRAALC